MTFFGTRRARQTRVLRPTQSWWERLQQSLQDYQTVKQLLIGATAVVVLLLALQAWQTRLPYREGQYIPDGVLSRIDFRVENISETSRVRQLAEDNAPLVFAQHNEVIDNLTATFRSQLSAVANAKSADKLEPSVSLTFGLNQDKAEYDKLHGLLTETESAGELLDQLVLEFSQWLSGVRILGILDATALAALEERPIDLSDETRIEIVSNEEGHRLLSVAVFSDVILEDQLEDTGTLGKAWADHSTLQPIRPWVETWLTASLKGHLVFNEKETNNRRLIALDETEPQYDFFAANSVLIPAGSQITSENKLLLVREFEEYELVITNRERCLRVIGAAVMLIAMVVLVSMYIGSSEPELASDPTQLLALVAMCGAAVGAGALLSADPWRAEIIPVMATVIVVAIVHNRALALLVGFCLCVMVAFATLERLEHFSLLMLLCVTVIVPLKTVSSRSTIIKIGFVAALVGFSSVWGLNLLQAHPMAEFWQNSAILKESLKLSGWSLVCCFLVAGSLPFIERAFGIVTDISLLELTAVSHPLLQELARRAPGSYNHSLNVAAIGEAAADAIGAHGLLVRVGAYFHDIGKMLKPEYFIENMVEGQQSQHENLTPAMSALIIIGHVKDGSELAEQHNLPQHLVDFVEQHHGTTLVEYFYHEAAARAAARADEDHRTDADESTFRYPGPKPQSKETGVMMLADAVESASRTLNEPTPKRIQSLVKEITLKRLLDGQFDECGLTMSELRVVQESVVKTLLAVYHGRIKYPD